MDRNDMYFMVYAKNLALDSPNLGRKTSAVLVKDEKVLIADCNTFPPGVRTLTERFQKPQCYLYIEHAERKAIARAAKLGIALDGCTAYLPWFPCVECARMLVGVGAVRMVCVEPDWEETMYHFKDSRNILEEGGVDIEYMEQ